MHDITDLVGKTITAVVTGSGDTELLLIDTEEGLFTFVHEQDCCENVYFDDWVGSNPDSFIGKKVIDAYETTDSGDDGNTSYTYTFYNITMEDGSFATLTFRGFSNGYYSEEVEVNFYPPD